jgi:hypothetical protein
MSLCLIGGRVLASFACCRALLILATELSTLECLLPVSFAAETRLLSCKPPLVNSNQHHNSKQ